jgi:hypothetical protein
MVLGSSCGAHEHGSKHPQRQASRLSSRPWQFTDVNSTTAHHNGLTCSCSSEMLGSKKVALNTCRGPARKQMGTVVAAECTLADAICSAALGPSADT